MENKKEKVIKLLSNEPCREDAFEGHAHKRIALQIANIIKADDKRHIIGLEGGWGSGKSNLISLINQELNTDKVYDKTYDHRKSTYPFYVYDAWGHQADYQRRSILEELTYDLTSVKKILDSKKWNQKLENLLAKRRKTSTKEVPKIGIGLIVGGILISLTPLFSYIVGLIPPECWMAKILVSFAPYVLGLLYVYNDRKKNFEKYGQEVTWAKVLSESILVYKDKVKENETYTTISEKEPSSAEFKKWMEDVNDDLLPQKKTLVIVFDNMDRLPSDKVESLWSSIHSFFSDKTYPNIKVIIPFDRQHVQKAFESQDYEGGSYGNDFINKTFDVVFRVAPPIMSGWQQYMKDKWKEAFNGEEPHISVLQIYDALRKKHTPRKIIAFINEVATIKMTLEDNIPDAYIALFVFGKEAIEKDPITILLHPNFMGEMSFEYESNPNTIKYLSALYYQLPVENAMEVVFTQEATEALNSGNGERLKEMLEKMEISPILGKAIRGVANVENATKALSAIDEPLGFGDFGNMPSWLKEIWNNLYEKANQNNVDWSSISDFHVTLFQHVYSNNMAEDLIKGYLSIEDDKWNAQKYVETVRELKKNNDYIDTCLEANKRKVKAALFLELLKYTEYEYEEYGVESDISEVDEHLAGLEKNKVLKIDVIPFISLGRGCKLEKYEAKLKEWISDKTVVEAEELDGLFTRLKEIVQYIGSANNIIDDERLDGVWCEIADSDILFKYDLLAMRIARANSFSTAHKPDFEEALENNDADSVKKLAKVLERYVNYGELIMNSAYYKAQPLTVAVFNYLTTHSVMTSRASIMDCLPHFDATVADFRSDASALFNKLSRWSDNFVFDNSNVVKMPSGLFKQAETIDNVLSKALHKACEDYYDTLTQDEWKTHFVAKDATWRIWKLYHPKKMSGVKDALKSLLKDYADGTSATQPDISLVNEWLNICLELKHSVKGMFNEICNILKNGQRITAEKLLYFGDNILKYADMSKHTDFVEKLLPTDIIDDDEVIVFMKDHIEQLKECMIPEEFKEKLKELTETTRRDEENIVAICNTLGIEIAEPEVETDEESNSEEVLDVKE